MYMCIPIIQTTLETTNNTKLGEITVTRDTTERTWFVNHVDKYIYMYTSNEAWQVTVKYLVSTWEICDTT